MFTRYQGMKLPDNYGGSRFVQSNIENTQTKTHKANVYKAVKTTHSPTFEEARKDNSIHNTQNEQDIQNEENERIYEDKDFAQEQQEFDNFSNSENERISNNETRQNDAISLPPFYNGTLYSEPYQNENSNNESYLEKEFGEQEKIQNSQDDISLENENLQSTSAKNDEAKSSLQKGFGFSKFGELFGKIESDELLLLCIILLISGDSKSENSDILPILSLLLLNKK